MNIVYLSPHFPQNYYLFCVYLKNFGANVLTIADIPYDDLRAELKDAITEYYRVDDMKNYDQLLRACGYFTHVYGKLDRIESNNEFWLETEAKLRTDFNITGDKIHHLGRITRKSEMKRLFVNAGVDVPRGRVLKSPESALNLIKEIGFPVIIKPNRGICATNTFKVDSEKELKAVLSKLRPVKYVIEAFIEGAIHSFDGLCDKDGNIVFFTSHVFTRGIMETISNDEDIFYYSLRQIPRDLEDAGRRVVKTFGIKGKFFHVEFFRIKNGGLVGLEVNARPPGGITMDMFNFANNIDMYKEWANIIVNNRFESSYSRPYHCGYIGRKLNKAYIHSHRDIMKKYGYLIVFHGPMESAFSSAIGNYAYLANSENIDEIKEVARFIQATG